MFHWLAELGSLSLMLATAAATVPRAELWPAAVVIVLGAAAITTPDSVAGLFTLLAYGGWWFAVDPSAPLAAVLVVAVAGLVFHLSLAHAAAAPAGAKTQIAVLRSLLKDAGIVVLATGVASGVITALDGSSVRTPSFLIGVALVLVGLLPWIAAISDDPR